MALHSVSVHLSPTRSLDFLVYLSHQSESSLPQSGQNSASAVHVRVTALVSGLSFGPPFQGVESHGICARYSRANSAFCGPPLEESSDPDPTAVTAAKPEMLALPSHAQAVQKRHSRSGYTCLYNEE